MNFDDIANELIESKIYQKITFDPNYRSLVVDLNNVRMKIKSNSITIMPIGNKSYA